MHLYTLLYFSPTGNVSHLTRVLAEHLGLEEVTAVPLESTQPERLATSGHLVLLYPIHAFNPPRNVEDFVRRLPAGRFDVVSLIAVGSSVHWANQAVSLRLRHILAEKGYPIGLDEIVAMPLTIFVGFPDELGHRLVVDAERQMQELAASLRSARGVARCVPWKSRLMARVGRLESLGARLFGLELHANGRCTSCGTCWNHCPQGNIRRGQDDKPRFGFDCLMCMRCIYNCPEGAIAPRMSKFIPIKGGYSLSRYVRDGRRSS